MEELARSARAMEPPMLAALVLICSVAITPDLRDCTRANATAVMRVPADFGTPATCFLYGQAYLAQTSIGQELGDDERVKVVCARSELIDASIRRLEHVPFLRNRDAL
jgi:hypothetical protein